MVQYFPICFPGNEMILVILCALFGMVKWPFGKVKWPPTRGSKGHFESPGWGHFATFCACQLCIKAYTSIKPWPLGHSLFHLMAPKNGGGGTSESVWLEKLVYHFFRQLWLVLGVKLMEINSNLFSRCFSIGVLNLFRGLNTKEDKKKHAVCFLACLHVWFPWHLVFRITGTKCMWDEFWANSNVSQTSKITWKNVDYLYKPTIWDDITGWVTIGYMIGLYTLPILVIKATSATMTDKDWGREKVSPPVCDLIPLVAPVYVVLRLNF